MDAAQLIAEPMRTQGASRARSPAGSPGSGLRVLIIDDDDYMRMVIARLLRRLGTADVAEAANGIEAIAELRPERPRYDLLVCDIDMPGSDGMEFMRLAAESGITVPLLVLSGKAPALLRGVRIIGAEYGLKILRIAPKPPTVAILGQALADCRDAAQPEPAILSRTFSGKAIAEGLEQRQFEPFFQPKVRVETREVCGCEALARWRHPMHGLLPPAAFIADLEAAGLMEQLTGSIIEQSAVRCTNWRVAGFDVPVSVNLSMSSLSNTALADCLVDLVRAAGSAPSDFTLEVTETIGMTDVARCMETLVRLRLRGFGLSIDDFGTGHSSLAQLRDVPFTN